MSYESLSQQKLQLDKLCEDHFKYNFKQNKLKEIMERSAKRSLVILKWKKMANTIKEKLLRTQRVICQSAKEEQNHSKLQSKLRTLNNLYSLLKLTKKYNLRDRSKAESSKDKVPTFLGSEKQKQSSRNPKLGQKDDDDIEQRNQSIGNVMHSDTTSIEGGDDDNKDSNDNCNANSYFEFPLRHFEYSQKQRRTDSKTNFKQICERTPQPNDESNTECTSSKIIANFPNNADDHRLKAEQRKSNVEEDWTNSREATEVSYKDQNIGPIIIRRDIGTTTSNDKPKSYKHAKRKQKRHQSDVSTESECSSNQKIDTNIPDQRKTQKKHSHISNNQDNKTYILLTGNNRQIISRPYAEETNRQQKTTVVTHRKQRMKATII